MNSLRKDPDIFWIQAQRVIAKDLHEMYMKTETRRRFKSWSVFTRFLPAFKAHKDQLSTEEDLSQFLFDHYGYGTFNVSFRTRPMYISKLRRAKWKKKAKYLVRSVVVKRARFEIKEGYDSELKRQFTYRNLADHNKMHMMVFWKGKKRKPIIRDEMKVEVPTIEKIAPEEITILTTK